MDDKVKKAYGYLYDNADSIIRYEASRALGIDSAKLRGEMVSHPQVQYWLECSRQFIEQPVIHNSFDICLENWMHKLLSFGVKESDDSRLSEVNMFILGYIKANIGKKPFDNTINSTIAASWLACMGYEDKDITDLINERVETIHGFIKDGDYNIYINPEAYPSIPKARAMHPLVDPSLYENEKWKLPTIHDIFAFANLPEVLKKDPAINEKIDEIIGYILDERYQQLYRGYGLMLVPPRQYYGMGWSVHLDNYFEADNKASLDGVVWAMEQMSHFKAARRSEWFSKTFRYLKTFGTDETDGTDGTYGLFNFPPNYLNEGKNKYYVFGGHMGLGENRRARTYLRLESTAWMMRIICNDT